MEKGKCRGDNEKGLKRRMATAASVIYCVWGSRNKLIFENHHRDIEDYFSELQIKCFEWISKRDKELAMEWSSWLIDPFGVKELLLVVPTKSFRRKLSVRGYTDRYKFT